MWACKFDYFGFGIPEPLHETKKLCNYFHFSFIYFFFHYLVFQITLWSTGFVETLRVSQDDTLPSLIHNILEEGFQMRYIFTFSIRGHLNIFTPSLTNLHCILEASEWAREKREERREKREERREKREERREKREERIEKREKRREERERKREGERDT